MIDVMLALQEREPENYSDDIIKGNISTMLLAGTNPLAMTVEWALSLLVNHPNVLEKARVELDSIVGHNHLVLMNQISLSCTGSKASSMRHFDYIQQHPFLSHTSHQTTPQLEGFMCHVEQCYWSMHGPCTETLRYEMTLQLSSRKGLKVGKTKHTSLYPLEWEGGIALGLRGRTAWWP
ncbi:hypothetical protein RJ639_003928 [Escallonia herrerae]|uniref:Cytochrome P450 n=1 Tax=Escallonia herrerae TaxID=1293975 RepID=A0AA89AWK2_9ASTE|nr:hypothetical protein RJ639_003928 [Escallonia herrerae]